MVGELWGRPWRNSESPTRPTTRSKRSTEKVYVSSTSKLKRIQPGFNRRAALGSLAARGCIGGARAALRGSARHLVAARRRAMADEEKHADLPEPLDMDRQEQEALRQWELLPNPKLEYEDWFLANERRDESEWGRVLSDMLRRFPGQVHWDTSAQAIFITDKDAFENEVLAFYFHKDPQPKPLPIMPG